MFPVRLNLFNFKDGHLKIKKKGEKSRNQKEKKPSKILNSAHLYFCFQFAI